MSGQRQEHREGNLQSDRIKFKRHPDTS